MSRLIEDRAWAGRLAKTTWLVLVFAAAALTLTPSKASAMKIQEVKSPGGITAWLVEEHSVPLIAVRFAFDGGSSQDPVGKDGLANFLSGMLDEGAGNLNSKQFQERMEEIAMRMSFEDGRDAFYGSFETLTQNRDGAVELLTLAINRPRFDADAVERMRASIWPASWPPPAIPRAFLPSNGWRSRLRAIPTGARQRHAAVGGRDHPR